MTHDPIAGDAFTDPAARRAAASRSVLERQHLIDNLLVRYERFTQTVEAMRIHHWPLAEGTYRRGTIRGIIGPSRAGKSKAIKFYTDGLGPTADNHRVPRALYVDAAYGWTSLNLANDLLDQLALPVRVRGSVMDILDKIRGHIARLAVELVVIDDAQFLLLAKTGKTVAETVGFITRLAEMNVCNVVLAGTEELALAIKAHTHAYKRGSFPAEAVVPYDWLTMEGREDFESLLMKIDERLPFKEYSNLAAPKRAAHFYRVSNGLIGTVMDYVKDAAIAAINDKADRIENRHLIAAAQMRRAPNDPFEPFKSKIDLEDPTGDRRKLEEALLHAGAPAPTLKKRRRRSPLG